MGNVLLLLSYANRRIAFVYLGVLAIFSRVEKDANEIINQQGKEQHDSTISQLKAKSDESDLTENSLKDFSL